VHLIKIAGTSAAAILLAATIAAQMSHECPQPAASSVSKPISMNDFKKRDAAEPKKKLSDDQFQVTPEITPATKFFSAEGVPPEISGEESGRLYPSRLRPTHGLI
jgi:predicted transglutaminase-like cysteine proteinase